MLTLGELERSVMDLLWASATDLSAYELQDRLAASESPSLVDDHGPTALTRKLAATTVLTVLSRLEKKGFVERDRDSRPHRYRAARSREDHMADLMHQVLGDASDRAAVLERFVGRASPGEAETLRKILESSGP